MKGIIQNLKTTYFQILLGIFVFVLFRKSIEDLFIIILIDPIFSKINTSIWKDLTLVSVLIIIIYNFFKRWRFKIFHENYFVISVLTLLVYSYYRFYSRDFIQEPFLNLNHLKYLDIIFVISFIPIYCYLKTNIFSNLPENTTTSFLNDKPLGNNGLDKLSYTHYAQSLADKIHSSYFDSSFAIGVNGRWGDGKTSFLDLVKKNLAENKEKHDEIIEVNFNAWSIQNPQGIIEDFFESFKESLQPYGLLFSDSLIAYSKKLKSVNSDYESTIETISNFIQPSTTIVNQLNTINQSLKKLNKKIIVYIDDLDRLNISEVLEILKLIRINANFYNTYFLVAYDRAYIKNLLTKGEVHNPELFLEKIFQLEISLPVYDQTVLESEITSKLQLAFPEKYHTVIKGIIENKNFTSGESIFTWIKTMRDVTRLSNSLILNLSKIIDEVNIHDFIKLEILRLKFPYFYDILCNSHQEILETFSDNKNNFHYRLKRINNEPKKGNNSVLRSRLENIVVEMESNTSYVTAGIMLIEDIFENSNSRKNHKTAHLSIEHPKMYFRYFALSLFHGNISEVQFTELWDKELHEIKMEVSTIIKDGKRSDFIGRLEKVKDFENIAHFEKVIKICFYLHHLPNQQNYLFSVGPEEILNKIYRFNNQIKGNIEEQGDFKISNDIQDIIQDILLNAKSPYFESDFISYLCRTYEPIPLFNLSILQTLAISYLDRYISEIISIDENLWRLFNDCKYSKREKLSETSFRSHEETPDSAIKLLKKFFTTKVYDEFLIYSLRKNSRNSKMYAVNNDLILMLFKDWENFELEVLSNEGDSIYLEEYKLFYSNYSDQNHSKFIKFDFKVIPIEKIRL